MKRKITKLPDKITSAIIFFSIFAVAYVLTALGFWVYSNYWKYNMVIKPMNRYVVNNREDLQSIFKNLFSKAETCLSMQDPQKNVCEKEVSHQMAVSLIEEDLNVDKYDWAHDLSLATQTGDRYYRLGWEGKLVDISSHSRKSSLHFPIPQFLKVITRNCNYVGTGGFPAPSCEVYASMDIDTNTKGYLIRHIGIDEETMLLVFLVLPIIALPGMIAVFTEGFASPFHAQFVLTIFFLFLIQLTIATVGTRMYLNRHSKKSKKK